MDCEVIDKCVNKLCKSNYVEGYYLYDSRCDVLYKVSPQTLNCSLRWGTESVFIKKGSNIYYVDQYY